MTFLSLFTGSGALDYGLERAGMRCVGQVELDEFCRAVLANHWPGLFRWSDICDLPTELVRFVCGPVACIAGGFACQDVSVAGRGGGIGRRTRSGVTWRNLFRLARGLRPAWLVIENVPALRSRGADRVIASLERIGYACWPVVVGAWAVGAPHKRDRVWIVARLDDARRGSREVADVHAGQRGEGEGAGDAGGAGALGDAVGGGVRLRGRAATARAAGTVPSEGDERQRVRADAATTDRAAELADAKPAGLQGQRPHAGQPEVAEPRHDLPPVWPARPGEPQHDWEPPRLADAAVWASRWRQQQPRERGAQGRGPEGDDAQPQQPVGGDPDGLTPELVRRVALVRGCTDGEAEAWWHRNKVKVSRRHNKEALKACGNAVVWPVPYLIGRWIVQQERGAA